MIQGTGLELSQLSALGKEGGAWSSRDPPITRRIDASRHRTTPARAARPAPEAGGAGKVGALRAPSELSRPASQPCITYSQPLVNLLPPISSSHASTPTFRIRTHPSSHGVNTREGQVGVDPLTIRQFRRVLDLFASVFRPLLLTRPRPRIAKLRRAPPSPRPRG
jgi:hypothetical protein